MSCFHHFRISFWKYSIFSWIMTVFFLCTSIVQAQDIQIIKASDLIAVINQGTANGIQKGDYFVVKRFMNNSWQKISYAEAVDVRENMTGIKVLDVAPQVALTEKDVVEKIMLQQGSSNLLNSELVQPSANSNEIQAASQLQRNERLVYLGPSAGLFMPLGDMKDLFENALCYGGTLGFRFRRDLDMSINFLYATKNQEWTFWNLQMLGRRYLSESFLIDFGYGVIYPEILNNQGGSFVSSGSLRLGICVGSSYRFPVALTTQAEIGFLLHLYPNFGDGSGEFLTIQGRLIL